ncbi:MAG TPA: hypothetical protein VKV26_06665 [Dehalococcoidia bacterium]|nr:hypothetical protein [Dehalococcoidia bacterium]
MAEWEKQELRLRKGHGWKAKPGWKIVVVGRGALRLDFPQDWQMAMETDEHTGWPTITLTDRPEPKDRCKLQVTTMQLPPEIPWPPGALPEVLDHAMSGPDEYEIISRGQTMYEVRHNLQLAWREMRWVEPVEHREARSHTCLVRRRNVQALMTFVYWPEDTGRFLPIWREMLRSLRLAEYVNDPTQGPEQ